LIDKLQAFLLYYKGMKKKSLRKPLSKRSVKKTGKKRDYMHFYGIALGMIIGAGTIFIYTAQDRPYVLGTSVFLARGDSGSEGSTSGSGSSGENERQEGSSQLNTASIANNPPPPPPTDRKPSIAPNTFVDCIVPGGKHVQITVRACSEINASQNRSHFTFTNLKSGKPLAEKPASRSGDEIHDMPRPSGMPQQGDLNGNHKQKGRGPGNPQEHKDTSNSSLDEINNDLDGDNVQLENADNNEIIIRKNHVEAQTPFPLSVDPDTKRLSVILPSGKKELSVMPDEAVERILQIGTLNTVENQASVSAGDVTDAASHTVLTELNNKPVFQIKGFSNKKVFGLFPASFAKTVYVSAEDGKIVQTDETFFTKALEAISF
jgi:hypothetical protein